MPLGSTKVLVSRSIKHFEEDKGLCGGDVLDLINASENEYLEGICRTHT